MPTLRAHLNLADRNLKTIDYLKGQLAEHAEWIATIAFYRALHLVEAAFSKDRRVGQSHSHTHQIRQEILKNTLGYEKIWEHYRPLYAISLVARYLEEDSSRSYSSFREYLSEEEVESEVLNHRLRQVEKSVGKILHPRLKKKKAKAKRR